MISCKNLSFSYPNSAQLVLNELSLSIQKGESVSIMGANGSGKSTLVQCLNGLLIPSHGDVIVDGLNTRDQEEIQKIRKKVGIVFQNPDNQIVSTTVEREIAFGLENLRVDPDKMYAIVNQFLKVFNLEHFRNHSPNKISGGEKQLLALASVLAMSPSYLVLDEPTSLLDPFSRRMVLDYIFKKNNNPFQQITSILITQYPAETFYTDRLLILSNGKILFDDNPDSVFKNSAKLCELGIGAPVEYLVDPVFQ